MSLIDEFLQQQLQKQVSRTILQKIQQTNNSLQSMVKYLSQVRDVQNMQKIHKKIAKIRTYLQLQTIIATQLKTLKQQNDISQWIMKYFHNRDNKFLFQFLRNQHEFLNTKVKQIIRMTILNRDFQNVNNQEIQQGNLILNQLNNIVYEPNNKNTNRNFSRDNLQELDLLINTFQQKILLFQTKVNHFNSQIQKLIAKIYGFQKKISNIFYSYMSQQSQQKNKPLQQQQQNNYIKIQGVLQNSFKSTLKSPQQSVLNIQSRASFQQTTPRKRLQQSQPYQPVNQFEKPTNQILKTRNQVQKPTSQAEKPLNQRAQSYQNKRSQLSYNNYMINNFQPQQLRNLNKTQSNFNHSHFNQSHFNQTHFNQTNFNQTHSNQIKDQDMFRRTYQQQDLYSNMDIGARIRLPTKWGEHRNDNFRSSLSLYPK